MPPTFTLIGGCNGAGKTTFARHYLPAAGISRFLNADEIAKGLSPLDPTLSAVRAGRLLLEELKALMDRRESFALESTLSGRTYVRTLLTARSLGYKVVVHYLIIASPAQAVQRVAARVTTGGHHVPADDIARRFHRSRQHLLEDYLPLADEWKVWDNSEPPAVLIGESADTSIAEIKSILEGLRVMEKHEQTLSEDTRIAMEAHRRATEEMMNYFMRMEIEVPEHMLNAEWKQKFADWKRKMAA
jgi:predicted ABC-type ATPase